MLYQIYDQWKTAKISIKKIQKTDCNKKEYSSKGTDIPWKRKNF